MALPPPVPAPRISYDHLLEYSDNFSMPIAAGGNGQVCKAMVPPGNPYGIPEGPVVIKRTNSKTPEQEKDQLKHLRNEIDMLERMHGRTHTIKILGVCEEESKPLCLVLEYASKGNLLENISDAKWKDLLKIAKDIGGELLNLHTVNLVHGDIKPENFLVFEDGTTKLADFGTCAVVGETDWNIGTPGYFDQERAKENPTGKELSDDIYAFAVSLLQIFMKRDNVSVEVAGADRAKIHIVKFANSLQENDRLVRQIRELYPGTVFGFGVPLSHGCTEKEVRALTESLLEWTKVSVVPQSDFMKQMQKLVTEDDAGEKGEASELRPIKRPKIDEASRASEEKDEAPIKRPEIDEVLDRLQFIEKVDK